MIRRDGRPPLRRVLGPTAPLLFLATAVLAFGIRSGGTPTLLEDASALVGVALGVGLRAASNPLVREAAPLPPLVALGFLATKTPLDPLADLLVGAAGVVFVAWLLDDPSRPPAGLARGVVEWAIPALAVGLAWTSAFLLPGGAASFGVAGGLLAASLFLLAYLVRRPELFDRDEGATI
ncbi:MAG: hypothetical protein ACREDE_01135 [Thermoplasmata archaeon]